MASSSVLSLKAVTLAEEVRFLQSKLEERVENQVHLLWDDDSGIGLSTRCNNAPVISRAATTPVISNNAMMDHSKKFELLHRESEIIQELINNRMSDLVAELGSCNPETFSTVMKSLK